MELNKFAYLYSKPLGNHTLKIMKKYLEIHFKNLEKSWKYHGILSVRKSGNPDDMMHLMLLPQFPPRPMDRQTWAVNIVVILLVLYSLLLNMISTSCCFRLRRKNNRRWKLSRRKQSLCSSRSDNRTGIQLT